MERDKGIERERERQRNRETETESDRDRVRERQRERETERHRQTDRQKERERGCVNNTITTSWDHKLFSQIIILCIVLILEGSSEHVAHV